MNNIITCFDKYGNSHPVHIAEIGWRISVSGILQKNDAVFVIKHPRTQKWEFPGGGVEIGESVEKALKREFFEEVNINISVNELVGFYESFYYMEKHQKGFQGLRLFFHVNPKYEDVNSDGEYVEISNLNEKNCNETTLYALKYLKK